MADVKISNLPAASSVADTDSMVVVQGGVTKKASRLLVVPVDTDGTLAANSDTSIATQKAVKTYVDSAVTGLYWKQACKYATTAALPSNVYANGSSGVGATLTGAAFGALSIDGSTPSVADRILVKDESTGANNGIYTVTVVGGVATLYILTRSTDFDQTSEINNGDTVSVISGTANAESAWAVTAGGAPTMGSTTITFTRVVDTTLVTLTGSQTLANKTLTSPILITPALGTPASGVATNLTGTAAGLSIGGSSASLSVSGQTGLITVTGLASSNRIKTVRDAADTILELGGSYTPTGTWTSLTLITPALGTPASGVGTNLTGIPESGVTNLTTDLAAKAPLASPTFTGTVTLPSGQALVAPALGTPASGNLSNCTGGGGYVLSGGSSSSMAPADATTYYFGDGDGVTIAQRATLANIQMTVPKAGTIRTIFFHLFVNANGTNEQVQHYLRLNNTTDTTLSLTETYDPGATTTKAFAYTGLSIAVAANDTIAFKIITPTWATNPTLSSAKLVIFIE